MVESGTVICDLRGKYLRVALEHSSQTALDSEPLVRGYLLALLISLEGLLSNYPQVNITFQHIVSYLFTPILVVP